MHPTQLERDARYLATPRGQFVRARQRAQRQSIVWKLTYDQWWGVWKKSGHWADRGRGAGKYHMKRVGDTGAYEWGNVLILPCSKRPS